MLFFKTIRDSFKWKRVMNVSSRNFYQQMSIKDLPSSKVKIRHRRYLPGASSQNFPEYISTREHDGLEILNVDKTVKNLKEKLGNFIGKAIKEHPAILIKGLGLSTAQELSEYTKHFPFKPMEYESGVTIRHEVVDCVFTASDETNKHNVELHNELSYVENSPGKILFSCLHQSEIGGETAISFNRNIQSDLDPAIREKMRNRNIRYLRNLGDGENKDYLSWQDTFGTNSKDKAERIMSDAKMKWEWNEIGGLSTYNVVDSERSHPYFNELLWFNQATACHWTYYGDHVWFNDKNYEHPKQYPSHACYGDGEEFEPEVLDHIREVHWKNAIPLKLEKGDILLLDNYLCCHSRIAFEGKREILTQLFH